MSSQLTTLSNSRSVGTWKPSHQNSTPRYTKIPNRSLPKHADIIIEITACTVVQAVV